MPLFTNQFSGDACFISNETLANPPQGLIDNMSGVYITPDGLRYVSNGTALVPLLTNAAPFVYSGTWFNLLALYPPASTAINSTALVVDPTYFIAPFTVRNDGAKWRLTSAQDLAFNITPLTGAAGTVSTEQLQKQWTAPAGFLTSLRWLSVKRLDYKGATSDIYTFRLRAGAGVTPLTDALIFASASMQATTRSAALETLLTFTSSTNARMLGQMSGAVSWPGLSTSIAYPTNVAIPDSDIAATVFSCTFQLTTGTDSSTSGQAHLIVTGN